MMANEIDTSCSDSKLTKKLLREDPDQFYTLVRMHLSFVLDLNTDDCDVSVEKSKFKPLKWNFLSKKPRSALKGVVEKVPLTEEGLSHIAQLINFLSKGEHMTQEGIFRLTGALSRQNKLKSLISQGLPLNLEDGQFSVHDCASVLKSFLSELPEPLLCESYYPAYLQISELCMLGDSAKNRLLRSLQLLLLLLPAQNRSFLKDIIRLLNLTASYEDKNKMSAENLATLFTPHLLCPRKLTPEAFHINSQKLSRVLVFMIQVGLDLFEVPPTLATDIRAYWADKNRKQISTQNESGVMKESRAVNTVFSFVDRARTAQENNLNPTEEALAQLYAHIQSMPESSKKRRLVKQFNKENGQGTPRQFPGCKVQPKSKSIGDSIKKHILHKNGKTPGKLDHDFKDEKVEISQIGCLSADSSLKIVKSQSKKCNKISEENAGSIETNESYGSIQGAKDDGIEILDLKLLEEESCKVQKKSPKTNNGNFETSYTSPTCTKCPATCATNIRLKCSDEFSDKSVNFISNVPVDSLKNQFFSPSLQLHRKNSMKTFNCTPIKITASTKPCNVGNSKFNNFTSTPACKTPSPLINDDMSPITQSAQKMTKAMQETMMTPRSRKPVIAISDSNLSNLTDIPWSPGQNSMDHKKFDANAKSTSRNQTSDSSINSQKRCSSSIKKDNLSNSNDFHDSHLLTDTFCDYLYSRSILTASPVDLSFSSRTGDFEHSSSNTLSLSNDSSITNDDEDKSMIFSDEERISRSLLYFLDGNEPPLDESGADSSGSRKRSASDSGLFSPSECLKKSACDLLSTDCNKIHLPETSL